MTSGRGMYGRGLARPAGLDRGALAMTGMEKTAPSLADQDTVDTTSKPKEA